MKNENRLIRVLIPYLLNIGLDKMEDYEGTNTCLSKIRFFFFLPNFNSFFWLNFIVFFVIYIYNFRVVGLLDPKTLKFSGIKDSKPIFVNSTGMYFSFFFFYFFLNSKSSFKIKSRSFGSCFRTNRIINQFLSEYINFYLLFFNESLKNW